jgi:hypothetical protein
MNCSTATRKNPMPGDSSLAKAHLSRFARERPFPARLWPWLGCWVLIVGHGAAAPLNYAPAPADNPLKGFVPYSRQARSFPHSLEFNYLPLRSLMAGPEAFNWQPLDQLLQDVASRGCQTIFRVWLEYPGKPSGVPQFLLDQGLRLRRWTNTNTQPFPSRLDHTPDYEDPRLRAVLTNFIHALGRRYDGDPRVGGITAGLLGTWGEWHTFPHPEWFASKTFQREVMDAYEAAFKTTPVLLRYPAGEADSSRAPNASRSLGYHDDSFAWATLETGRRQDEWFFLSLLRKAGPAALDKWRMHPIGGEIRPEVWPCLWTAAGCRDGQDYLRCVEAAHASWLMESSTARGLPPDDQARAIAGAQRLGYELFVASADVSQADGGASLAVSLLITNAGIAPFYAVWPVNLAALDAQGRLATTWPTDWKLSQLMPGHPPPLWRQRVSARQLAPGSYRVLLGVPNPMPGGRPMRFANREQDQHLPGWLTLGEAKLGVSAD